MGHYLGHWLSATALAFASTSHPPARTAAGEVVAALAKCQLAWGARGHQVGTISDGPLVV
eukprot:7997931-Pyramimonas_sp.AAC.1